MKDEAFVVRVVKFCAIRDGAACGHMNAKLPWEFPSGGPQFHVQLLPIFAGFYFVDPGEKPFFEFGNGSHIPHDFAFFSMSHFIPGKQHNRRFPEASISHAFSIRRLRVSGCLAEHIQFCVLKESSATRK
jgi:hypothetical protein